MYRIFNRVLHIKLFSCYFDLFCFGFLVFISRIYIVIFPKCVYKTPNWAAAAALVVVKWWQRQEKQILLSNAWATYILMISSGHLSSSTKKWTNIFPLHPKLKTIFASLMGNSNSHSTNQSAHEQQQQQEQQPNPSTNTNRIRFSPSLTSLSNFTSKYIFRTRRSYSLSTIDPTVSASARPTSSHQVKINLDAFHFL